MFKTEVRLFGSLVLIVFQVSRIQISLARYERRIPRRGSLSKKNQKSNFAFFLALFRKTLTNAADARVREILLCGMLVLECASRFQVFDEFSPRVLLPE